MPKLKLRFFDYHGGRGEVARIALQMGGIEYEDHRIPIAKWDDYKPNTPFAAVPVLEVDGVQIAQSNAINRYCGKLAGYYPEDPLEAAFCDEAMDAIEEFGAAIIATLGIEDAGELKAQRQALSDGPLTRYLKALDARLEARGGQYFADGRLTVADLRVFLWVRHIKSGGLEHVPADLPDRRAPNLAAHFERVKRHSKVVAYYEYRGI